MPPKKMGVNSKAEEAKARKAAAEAEKKDLERKQKEDQYWREAEGSKSKAAKKREEEEQKRAEAAAKKAEARRLAELEEKEIDKSLKKPDKKANRVSGPMIVTKVTEAELQKRREKEEEEIRRRAEENKKKQSRMAGEEEYEKIVLVENKNRDDGLIEARSVEEALAQMSVSETLPVDKHPEKRLKASFKMMLCFFQFSELLARSCHDIVRLRFEEAELPRLKAEKPGLTHTQYKEMIWKLWKKSPDNPLNRVAE